MRSWNGEGITHPQLTSVAVSLTERSGSYGVVYAGTEPSWRWRALLLMKRNTEKQRKAPHTYGAFVRTDSDLS